MYFVLQLFRQPLNNAPLEIVNSNNFFTGFVLHVTCINLLKPSGFFTYHRVERCKILHGARFALRVLCESKNREWPLLYTSLTDGLL